MREEYKYKLIIQFLFKDAVESVLRINSGHNKWGPADVNIAQTKGCFPLSRFSHTRVRT